MAQRRMFARSIIESDAFLELPPRCQLLYFHLGMQADDDGFVNRPKSIQRMTGCTEEDLKKLVETQYLMAFDSGIVAIRHWKMHNYIPKDRYRETIHQKEKAMLEQEENRAYTTCIQPVHNMDTQDRLGKDRSAEDRSAEESIGACIWAEADAAFRAPTLTEVMIYVKQKKYQVDPDAFLRFYHKNGWRENGKPMKDWKGAVDLWQARGW